MHIVALSGSPGATSRSNLLLGHALGRLDTARSTRHTILLRELPPAALLQADVRHPAIAAARDQVAAARLVLIATPIYKASFSGLLKTFLDLLPQDGLAGKTVLPLATGGSLAHLLALAYALQPVLSALGARHVLSPVFAVDSQITPANTDAGTGLLIAPELTARIDRSLADWADAPRVLRTEAELAAA